MLICCLQTKEQRVQTQLLHDFLTTTTFHSRKCKKGRVSSSYPGIGAEISALWNISPWSWKCGRIASTEIFFLKTHLWHLWLLVKVVIILRIGEHSLVKVNVHFEPELTSRHITWQCGHYSPTLARISTWCVSYVGRFQKKWSGRRMV